MFRPVRKGDQFIVTGGKYSVEFEIIEIDPAEYCVVVTPTTEIFCEGEHGKRDDKVLESARLLYGDRSVIKQGEGSFTRYGTPPSSPKSSGSEEPHAASVEEVVSTPPRTVTRVSPSRKVNCPICGRNMHHEKAFCGHIRWHTQEERDAKSGEIQETLALSRQVEDAVEIAKKIKIPDLNKLPQPEDDDDAADA
nr:cell division cycle protein 48 homolog [Tanacetum cinerariifolium]